jgi:hypothetical protein
MCIIPQAVTQSSAPEDGHDHRPKHVELIGIINKPLLLHLVGVYIIYENKSINRCARLKSVQWESKRYELCLKTLCHVSSD